MRTLARLRTLSSAEAWWRTRALARVQRDRLCAVLRQPRWTRTALPAVLAPEVARSVRSEIDRGQWRHVHEALAQRLRQRPTRFVLDPASAAAVRTAILTTWPDAAGDAAQRADRVLADRYDLLGYRDLSFRGPDGEIDWHLDPVHQRRAPMRFWADVPYLDPACGDHKIIWELNRHQHWLAIGRALWLTRERRYRRAILGELASWLAANPPLTGINWASMLEAGFRSLSWIWALHVLLGDEAETGEAPWLVDLLIALDRQLTHVERNLSYYFSPNTHLTGEALALYVAGRALPEVAASARWAHTGRAILLAEIDRQITADGGHVERSTHYHRYTLDFYLLALLVARRSGDAGTADRCTDAVNRLAPFMRAMADDRGRIPLIGDDDAGMLWPFRGPEHADVRPSLALAAVVLDRPELAPWPPFEEVYWLAWNARPAAGTHAAAGERADAAAGGGTRSLAFPDTGYIVMRDASGSHLTFDVGPHGYLNGGHAHADALAVTLTVDNRPLLIDPGTATYTMDTRRRDQLRRSISHNTVTVNGRSSAEPAGPFHWASRTDARLSTWRGNPRFGWAEAAHDGYAGLRHRRSVIGSGLGWVVIDEIHGQGEHRADAHWHFDPAWHLARHGSGRLRAQHPDGAEAWLLYDAGDLRLARGEPDAGIGWCSPGYGTIQPTWTARVTHVGTLPLVLVTWVVGGRAERTPLLQRRHLEADSPGAALALHLTHDGLESLVVVRPGEAPVRDGRTCTTSEYRTDARLLRVSERDGRFVCLELADGTQALGLGDDRLTVSASEWIADLHVSAEGERLDVWASTPPARLELCGSVITDLRCVRMNGRELPVSAFVRRDRLIVHGVEGPPASAAAGT